MLTPRFESWCE